MDKNNKGECGICKIPYFERNNFFYGKLMTVRDFFAEQCYFNEKRWFINKSTIGSGVVCGLEVVEIPGDTDKVKVMPGIAIDCCGREILVCQEQLIELEPEEDECREIEYMKTKEKGPEEYLICIRYWECKTEPLPLPPISCDQKEHCEFNRIRDSFKIRVIPYYEPCVPEPFCPQDKDKKLPDYLCQRLLKDCPDCPDCPDCSEPHCVILAKVTVPLKPIVLIPGRNQDTEVKLPPKLPLKPKLIIDNCSMRKLVYSNQILYDLIHCYHGDLPHITNINWMQYHGKEDVEWASFNDLVTNGFTVTFDKKMDLATINRFTFLFAVFTKGSKAGYRKREYIYPEPGEIITDDNKTFTILPDIKWRKDEVAEGGYSMLRNENKAGFEVEITLIGDQIMSAGEGGNKALDGNFIGGKLPSGNGMQGGDFVSRFHVLPSGQYVSTPVRRRIKSKKIDK